jgi:hypothetical protein
MLRNRLYVAALQGTKLRVLELSVPLTFRRKVRYSENVSKQKEAVYKILKQKINSNLSQKYEEHVFTNASGDVHYEVTHQILSSKLCYCVIHLNI